MFIRFSNFFHFLQCSNIHLLSTVEPRIEHYTNNTILLVVNTFRDCQGYQVIIDGGF